MSSQVGISGACARSAGLHLGWFRPVTTSDEVASPAAAPEAIRVRKRMRLRKQPCQAEGATGTPTESLLDEYAEAWCYSARQLICVSPAVCDFVKSRSARSHPGRRAEECPPRRALPSLRWLRVPFGTRTDMGLLKHFPGAGGV